MSQQDLNQVKKEIGIATKVNSEHCVRLYAAVQTSNYIYMFQEYANCFDLECLLE